MPTVHTPPLSLPRVTCRLEVLPGRRVIDKVRHAHAFGFDGIALPGRFIRDWRDEARAGVRDSPLPFTSISLGFEGSLLSPHAELRRGCRDSLMNLMDLCADLGVRLLNVPPVLTQDNPDRITDAAGFPSLTERLDALLLEQLPEVADAAQARGVTRLLEAVNRYESDYLNSVVHAARLCERLNQPHVAVTADFFHMQIEELDTATALRQSRPWVRPVHVAENTRVEPGPGSLNFAPGFRALKKGHYQGLLEIECRSLSGPPEQVLPRSVRYLRRLWETKLKGSGASRGCR